MFAYLTSTIADRPGRTFVLEAATETLIGRGPECQIVLSDPLCSRVHAVLEDRDGHWHVRDQSRNGTLLNGQAIQEAMLADGHVLRIGETELAFHLGEQSPTLAAELDLGLTQTIVRDTPVTACESDLLSLSDLRDSPDAQDLWLVHQFAVRCLERRAPIEIVSDALDVLRQRTGASTVAYYAVDLHGRLRSQAALPAMPPAATYPAESLARLIISGGRALWVAQQQPRGHGGQHDSDVLYLPVVMGDRTCGVFRVELRQGHFRQSQFELGIAVANLTSKALAATRDLWTAEAERFDAHFGDELVADSPAMQALCERLAALASTAQTVLLRGESGVGKEFLARWLHRASAPTPRDAGPFVRDEGHVDRLELWASVQFGTLFIAEVGRLSQSEQLALLHALTSAPIDGPAALAQTSAGRPPDLFARRVFVSTSVDLRSLARRGEFSGELLDLLVSHEVVVPPLRERREDILSLAERCLERLRSPDRQLLLSDAARQRLVDYDWPGNVRQLGLALQLAALGTLEPVIESNDLPLGDIGADEDGESLSIETWERKLIAAAMRRAGGNVPEAARLLGISRATLYRKLEEYAIPR